MKLPLSSGHQSQLNHINCLIFSHILKLKELSIRIAKSSGYLPSSAEVKQMPGQGHIIEAQQASRPPLFPIQTDPSVTSLQVASSVPAKSSNISPVRASSSAMDKLSVYGLQSLPHGIKKELMW
ncbi:hypothetical protein HPP92_021421 [Vanilla planifolia]|uniref:Uncharacterized protein n=1 Tax=Vanilla planifolia TaxID=51239 RepID=A0A835Q2B6_VANPL|nr:hypothetical protein HPP92_021421 [Vanilla planifolia]